MVQLRTRTSIEHAHAKCQEGDVGAAGMDKIGTSYSPVLHDGALKVQLPGDVAAHRSCKHHTCSAVQARKLLM